MFTNGVSIILTGTNDDYQGMAIAWVCQVEKEHLIISIPKGAEATKLLLQRAMFSVNELGVGQENLAREFGGKNCENKPSSSLANITTKDNIPTISNCCSSTICRVVSHEVINEQVVITAYIMKSQNNVDLPPLIFDKSVYFK
jgi:flavin reductase (DIM6/NTAB) family NADH-FMN oxidoreductase RutF